MKKIKVAMICKSSNPEIRANLKLSDLSFYNFFLKICHQSLISYSDFAPWINCITSNCIDYPDIEMHVIMPHQGVLEKGRTFEIDSVYYHVFREKPNLILQAINRRYLHDRFVKYSRNYRRIQKIVDSINPDLIVLVGAENPSYSGSVLEISNKPILLLCQTVFNNEEFKSFYSRSNFEFRCKIEGEIIKKTPYIGCYSDKHAKLLRENPDVRYLFEFHWPNSKKEVEIPQDEKKYDFINFANTMSSQKGYHDSVLALAKVKKLYPDVKLVLVNHGPMRVQNELEAIINENGLQDNVSFVPFFENREDLFKFLGCVRFGVLPCKVDYISGTMLQSMSRGLPIVVYRTEGTPTLNDQAECVLISEMNDIDGLADNMIRLMSDEGLCNQLRENSLRYMSEQSRKNEGSMNHIVSLFNAVCDNYYKDEPIPDSLLINKLSADS